MSAIDSILEGDEKIVQMISQEMGMIAAERFVEEFNNGCLHMAGFEDVLSGMRDNSNVFYSPLASLSIRMDH